MARFRYFADVNGETVELDRVFHDGSNSSKAAAYKGVPVGTELVFVQGKGWTGYVPATRCIEFKSNPSRHECDARCLNATGRIMKCECACGGKNHGRGSSFKAVAA